VSNDIDPRTDGTISWDDLHPETKKLLSRRSFLGNSGKASLVMFGAFSLALVACGDDSSTADTTASTAAGTKSLYDRLGGNAAITAVIGDFVDKQVVPDARINTFFANTDLTNLKKLLVEFTANAAGGPEKYTGRDMKSSHAGMNVTTAAFNALVEDLSKSLDVFKVPAQEKTDLLNKLAPLSADIVTA
jgi:hemoglobin